MMDDFERGYGLKSVRLRYFNAAGADPTGEIGEHHGPETHLIPLILDTASGLKIRSTNIRHRLSNTGWHRNSRLCTCL